MCDYSLHLAASRPAELAEIIEIKEFSGTRTRGFASPSDPGTAVCLRPGTEIAFEENAYIQRSALSLAHQRPFGAFSAGRFGHAEPAS
jgi:hypothetical protein